MKKVILSLLLVNAFVISQAKTDDVLQTDNKTQKSADSGEKCFDDNTHIINLGAGLGSGFYYRSYRGSGYDYGSTPSMNISYEQALRKKVGPGYIGVGGYFGFQHAHSRYDYIGSAYYYQHNWNDYLITARAAYHWDVLNSKRAEVYAGMLIGARIQTYSYTTNVPDQAYHDYALDDNDVRPAFSVFAGARWYFVQHVALFGEVGTGISYVTGGVSFKF